MQRILVPVDGSDLSERAVPYAAVLAKAQGAAVTLVRVLEPLLWAMTDQDYMDPETYDDVMRAIRDEATERLADSRQRLTAAGIDVEAELIEGMAAGALLDCERRLTPDLVVMSTHGRTGVARFALGSVADRLVREGSAPVLLIPAFAEGETYLAHALVPLDGSPLAAQALPMVEALAQKPLTSVKLLAALGEGPSGPGARATFASEDAAKQYLQGVAERLAKSDLSAEILVTAGDAAEAIERAAAEADVVVMSTHGRGGLDRWRHGSVAERATRHLTIPRLLVRAQRGG